MYPQQPQVAMSNNHSSASASTSRSISSSPLSSPTNAIHAHARTPGSFINRPIYYLSGPHTGKTIRMELFELQKADLGRKYAKVDRRPLDPPPVVLLKMFEIYNGPRGEPMETETAYDETQLLGLLCTIDLFPAPSPDSPPTHTTGAESSPPRHAPFPPSTSHQASSSTTQYTAGPSQFQFYQDGIPLPTRQSTGYVYPQDTSDVVHYVDGFPITESSKQTQALVGATFVQPALIDYQGKKAVVFVFSDIAVKFEGTFILRYRVFDIFGKRDDEELGMTAETYGGTFRVYSTKEFPGLSASTELTKLLARWGVRLNIRETERRRRKRTASGGERTPPRGE